MSAPKASKTDLINVVAQKATINNGAASATVEAVLAGIAELSAGGQKLVIRGFGTFETKTRAARTGRNPQTGLPVEIPASTALTFKAAKPKA
jgi:DNA-binding protein HU-beta